MSMFVKICGLRDPEAVAAAIDAGADALGFVFADSPRRISAIDAAQLTRGVPARVRRIAVTRHPDNAELEAVFRDFAPDYLQTDVEDFADINLPANCLPLPVYREGSSADVADGSRVLFEGAHSGSGRTADWDEAAGLAARCELILAGGLNVDNVVAAIEHVQPWGVDVSSGVERERGVKDPALIRAFIARVRKQENIVE